PARTKCRAAPGLDIDAYAVRCLSKARRSIARRRKHHFATNASKIPLQRFFQAAESSARDLEQEMSGMCQPETIDAAVATADATVTQRLVQKQRQIAQSTRAEDRSEERETGDAASLRCSLVEPHSFWRAESRANSCPSHLSSIFGCSEMTDYRVSLIEDAYAKLSWSIDNCNVPSDRMQLSLHGLFAKVAIDILAIRSVSSGWHEVYFIALNSTRPTPWLPGSVSIELIEYNSTPT
ncbi:hypothetical protein THAOC_23941, partial [Thalassiosira oceanica]